jgi:ADP-ribosylglycohydrolase
MAAMLALLHASTPLSFADTIRKVIKIGGCNCSRANMVGACLGAAYGFQDSPINSENSNFGIPSEWITKTDKGLEILELALTNVAGVTV